MIEACYVVDTNFFIMYHRDLLPPDLYPPFWDRLKDLGIQGKWLLLECVKEELLRGNDFLVDWIKDPMLPSVPIHDDLTIQSYRKILQRLRDEQYYEEPIIANYADCADSWLVAFAHAHDAVIVTREIPNLKKKARVKIPDIAKVHGVKTMTVNEYMRQPDIRFCFRL